MSTQISQYPGDLGILFDFSGNTVPTSYAEKKIALGNAFRVVLVVHAEFDAASNLTDFEIVLQGGHDDTRYAPVGLIKAVDNSIATPQLIVVGGGLSQDVIYYCENARGLPFTRVLVKANGGMPKTGDKITISGNLWG